MTSTEQTPYPTEADLDRLTADKEIELLELRHKLGQLVWWNIDLANKNPQMQGGEYTESPDGRFDENVAFGIEHKVGRRRSAHLRFAVSGKHEGVMETPEWLPLTWRIDLVLRTYDIDLPEDVERNVPDWLSESMIRITPARNIQRDVNAEDRRREPYIAKKDNEEELDAKNMQTIIGTLALIADKTERLIGSQPTVSE